MLVVVNILFELLTNVYHNGDTLLDENDLDIQQQPVVNNNIQLVLVAHIQLAGHQRIQLLVPVEPQRVEPQRVADKLRLVADKLRLVVVD